MKLDGEKGNNDKAKIQLHNNSSCKWGALRIAINKLLSRCGVNEDKLLSAADDVDEVYVNEVLPAKMKWNLESIRRFQFLREMLTMLRTVFAVLGKNYN